MSAWMDFKENCFESLDFDIYADCNLKQDWTGPHIFGLSEYTADGRLMDVQGRTLHNFGILKC